MKNIQKEQKESDLLKTSCKEKIRFAIYIVVAALSILADVFVFNQIAFEQMDTLVITCFSALISIAGIWVACYLLILELFRDRYQYNLIAKNNYITIKDNFYIVIYCICFGVIVMGLALGVVSSIVFCAISIATIIEILVKIFLSNKALMINSHINKIEGELVNKIESGVSFSNDDLKDFRYLFDECIIKEEYYIIQNIVEKSGNLFREFLKNCIGTSPKELEKSFDSLLKFNCMQLDFCKSIKSDVLIDKIANQQYKNLKFCIENYQSEWYKKYLNKIKIYLVCKSEHDSRYAITKDLFYYIYKTNMLLVENDNKNLLLHTLKEIQEFVSLFKFECKQVEIDNFVTYNYAMLSSCIEKEYHDAFKTISEYLCEFTKNVFIKDIAFSKFKSYYALIFNYHCEHDKNKAIEFFEDTMATFHHDINSTEFMSFKYFCVNELYDLSKEDIKFHEKVFNLHIDILNLSMSSSVKPDKVLLPDLEKTILQERTIKEIYVKYIKTYKTILNTCIIENEAQHFYKFLNCVNSVLNKTESKDKDLQIELLDIYVWAIIRTKNLANKNFYKIAFELLEDVIKDIDRTKQISENLGNHIICILLELAESFNSKNREIINSSIELLREFSREGKTLYFLLNYPKCMSSLHKALFKIGTNCIENNYEEGVRMISDTIGWLIIANIKRSNHNNVNYLIDRAIDLYEMTVEMELSKTTRVFIATLFTTIGAYCSKDVKLYTYRNRIIKRLKAPIDIIKVAARLRTSENDTWDELFDKKTDVYTKAFISAYKEQHP